MINGEVGRAEAENILELSPAEEEQIVNYLLGDLSVEEASLVETRYFDNPAYLEQIDAIEGELIEDYVTGSLAPEMRAKVEVLVSSSPHQQNKVKFARLVLEAAEAAVGEKEKE
ncbi:MAG: hypothetical protein KBD66_03575 [Candidatus Doudnabacteria bacterium]|nr:hypothetical protein [Candidatus Doudnabacteria bacterium]